MGSRALKRNFKFCRWQGKISFMEDNKRELIFIFILMVAIFVMGVGASLIFIKTYRREQREKQQNSE